MKVKDPVVGRYKRNEHSFLNSLEERNANILENKHNDEEE